jgi:hypothetical protein
LPAYLSTYRPAYRPSWARAKELMQHIDHVRKYFENNEVFAAMRVKQARAAEPANLDLRCS